MSNTAVKPEKAETTVKVAYEQTSRLQPPTHYGNEQKHQRGFRCSVNNSTITQPADTNENATEQTEASRHSQHYETKEQRHMDACKKQKRAFRCWASKEKALEKTKGNRYSQHYGMGKRNTKKAQGVFHRCEKPQLLDSAPNTHQREERKTTTD